VDPSRRGSPIAAAGLTWWLWPRSTLALGWRRYTIEPATSTGDIAWATVSPGGHRLAYVRGYGRGGQLWMLDLRTHSQALLVPSSPRRGIGPPSFSPDAAWIYFNSAGRLERVGALGGEPQVLSDVAASGRFAVSPDGSQVAFIQNLAASSRLMVMRSDGSGARTLAERKADSFVSGATLAWSPGGKRIAAVVQGPDGPFEDVVLVSAADGAMQRLGKFWALNIWGVAWLPDNSGVILTAMTSGAAAGRLLTLALPGGAVRQISNNLALYTQPTLSRDGTAAALIVRRAEGGIWISPPNRWDAAAMVENQMYLFTALQGVA